MLVDFLLKRSGEVRERGDALTIKRGATSSLVEVQTDVDLVFCLKLDAFYV